MSGIFVFSIVLVILVDTFCLVNLHERVSELEKKVYIYLEPKVRQIAEAATLKEGDN